MQNQTCSFMTTTEIQKNTEIYTAEGLSNSGHNLQNIDQLSGQMMKET